MSIQSIRRPVLDASLTRGESPEIDLRFFEVGDALRRLHNCFQTYNVAVAVGLASVVVTFDAPFNTLTYSCSALPDWSTTVFFSNKALGSIRINFGTVAPGSNNLQVILVGG